jgi:hypothetical protein
MNRGAELVRDAVTMLRDHGFTPIVSNGGRHLRVCWFDGGRRYTLFIPGSPSDHRARLNSRAMLRRILRNSNGGQS